MTLLGLCPLAYDPILVCGPDEALVVQHRQPEQQN